MRSTTRIVSGCHQALVTLAFHPPPEKLLNTSVLSLLIPLPLVSHLPSFIPSPSFSPSSTLVTDCQASSAAHLLCSRQLVSSDWHAQCVSWTDLPACIALLLKFLCQIPNEESVAGSAWLSGLSPPACLMKKTPVGFIIKELLITDRKRGVMARWGCMRWQNWRMDEEGVEKLAV